MTERLRNAVRQHLETEGFLAGILPRGRRLEVPSPPAETPGPTAALVRLTRTIQACQGCALSQSRSHAVPGEGNPEARIVFVGEAPGADEDAQGRPFVGRAGKLLDKIIAACGLSRESVYIANTLKCRPPNNRDPLPTEIDACLPYLRQQLALIKPEVIVALGAHAARTLVGSDQGIGRLRGQFHPCVVSPEDRTIPVMPTYHPAYLLRNYSTDNRRRVWEDMKKVLERLDLPLP